MTTNCHGETADSRSYLMTISCYLFHKLYLILIFLSQLLSYCIYQYTVPKLV